MRRLGVHRCFFAVEVLAVWVEDLVNWAEIVMVTIPWQPGSVCLMEGAAEVAVGELKTA